MNYFSYFELCSPLNFPCFISKHHFFPSPTSQSSTPKRSLRHHSTASPASHCATWSLTHSLTQSVSQSVVVPLKCNHSLTHSLTHPPTHSVATVSESCGARRDLTRSLSVAQFRQFFGCHPPDSFLQGDGGGVVCLARFLLQPAPTRRRTRGSNERRARPDSSPPSDRGQRSIRGSGPWRRLTKEFVHHLWSI